MALIFVILIQGGFANTKESLTLSAIYQEMQFTKTTNYCSFYDNKINSLVACHYSAAAMSIILTFICSKLYGRKLLVVIGFSVDGIHTLNSKEPSYPIHWSNHL